MRAMLGFAIAFALIGATGPADTVFSPEAKAKLEKFLEGRTQGEPRRCLPLRQVMHPLAIDDQTLVFKDGPRVWVNRLQGSFECGKVDKLSDVAFESGANQVCSGNTLFFSNGSLQGACSLGEFIPFSK